VLLLERELSGPRAQPDAKAVQGKRKYQ